MTRSSWNKRTEEEIKKVIDALGYIYINNYVKKEKTRVVIQNQNGYKYDVLFENILGGQGVSFVDKSNPFSLENISLWLKTNKSQFELLKNNEYKGAYSKLNVYCNKCKDYLKINWSNLSQGVGCGVCSGQQVGIYHNLEYQFPEIANEWHTNKNGNLTPKDITYASSKKVWWLCSNGHEYFSSVASRTKMNSGCKACYDKQKESKIANELKEYVLNKYDSKEEYPIFKNPETNRPLPFDIYIFGGKYRDINGVYIEVHGGQHYKLDKWHRQISRKNGTTPEEEFEYQKYKDKIKKKFAKKNGTYIEVDLRKIKTTEQAIEYIGKIMEKTLSKKR